MTIHLLPLAALLAARLRPLDLALVLIYLVGITLFGLRFRKRKGADKSLKSYFLADNAIPWWAIALSIVSAETSTLTIISIPGVAYAGSFGFLQIVIGYMLGRVVVAAIFLPRYFAGEMLTAYQLIDQRFGHVLHKVTAGLFLLTRAAAEGVRVFAVSIVVGIAIGTRDVLSIAIISALTLLYTFEGGMTAVIWTDVVQMAIYIGGTFVAIATLGSHVQGGWTEIHRVASAAGKFHMLDFTLNLTTTYTFWAGIVGGTFLTMASHGTDQLMVQRLLAARSLRESRLALLSSGVVIFVQFALFLLIGAGLYVFYAQHPAVFASSDRIFPTFIVQQMPLGIAGLLVAAILAAAMSNLSAALNSLSSTTVVDFYMRARPNADDRERGIIARSSTVLWALVLFAIAVYSVQHGGKGHVVETGLSIASVAYGCLLGVFLLGTLTKFANQTGATIGMVCGFALNLWLWQGEFPVHLGPLTIPHIAWTWYVFIGAVATFAVGALCSLIFRGRLRHAHHVATGLLLLFLLSFPNGICVASAQPQNVGNAPDFSQVSRLINEAINEHKLPGAVVVVGHGGTVVFEQAYGVRKLAGEPGLDGKPSAAEPMTEDTTFDMASLTKCLATATAIMQMYEQGKIASFDDPVAKYMPEFNAAHNAERERVTLRMLLTHTSGEPADVSLKDPWGLAAPERAEGLHLALTTPLKSAPAAVFRYSDINYILLGALVEKLSGESEDVYTRDHVFKPLGMTQTRYLPIERACGVDKLGAAIVGDHEQYACPLGTWYAWGFRNSIAPTTHDNEGTAQTNPDFDHLLRGTVNDPTTRRMGGVAGHAGVFSTAHDIALFAQALLDRLAGRPSNFPLKQSTLELMTTPEQPEHHAGEVQAANAAERAAIAAGAKPAAPLLAPAYPAIKNQDLRGFGWDIDTGFSKPRGAIFPIGSFGHTGFTGTSLWMDPSSDSYVILLANSIHPRGNAPISNLRGAVATAAASALEAEARTSLQSQSSVLPGPACCVAPAASSHRVLTGIDALEAEHFSLFAEAVRKHGGTLRVGLLTNQSGVDAQGRRTVDVLANDLPRAVPGAKLTALFSPEHGILAQQDSTSINAETDAATGLHIISLYGDKEADRHPTHQQLKDLDVVVIDLQDAGVRFWTYETVLGYFLEAATHEAVPGHRFDLVLLDRPNPIDGVNVEGPVLDAGRESYTGFLPLPVRHGMTFGELARYFNAQKLRAGGTPLHASLTIVRMQQWDRSEYFANTGIAWVSPSPNLRSPAAAVVYPALGLIEQTNVSVGRGTDKPFSFFGAGASTDAKTGASLPPWFHAGEVVAYLTARNIPGVAFAATKEHIADDKFHYPFHGQTIETVNITVTDRNSFDSPELGVEILSALHHLYPKQFALQNALRLLGNQKTMAMIEQGADPRDIAASWTASLSAFKALRAAALLYP